MILTLFTFGILSFGVGILSTGSTLKNKDAEDVGLLIIFITVWSIAWFQCGAQWQRDDWKDKIIQTHKTTPSHLPTSGLMPE